MAAFSVIAALPSVDWAADLLTGPGLPALYSLMMAGNGDGASSCGLAAAGGLLGMAFVFANNHVIPRHYISWPHSSLELFFLLSSIFRISLNSAQLFLQAARVDSDVGAGLCVAPLYALLCMQGTSSQQYTRDSRVAASVLTLVVLLVVGIYSANATVHQHPLLVSEGREDGEVVEWYWFLFAMTDTASAVANQGRFPVTVGSAFFRAFTIAIMGALPRALFVLLGPQPGWLFVLHGLLLVHSSVEHAGHVRISQSAEFFRGWSSQLQRQQFHQRVRSSQRSLMLMMAPAIAVGFTYQWENPLIASVSVLGLLVVNLVVWSLQWRK